MFIVKKNQIFLNFFAIFSEFFIKSEASTLPGSEMPCPSSRAFSRVVMGRFFPD
jgi:hypothetical protein